MGELCYHTAFSGMGWGREPKMAQGLEGLVCIISFSMICMIS